MATTRGSTGESTASAETLERLARLDTHGQPVLSVYVDLDPGRFPTPDTRETQVRALLAGARREGAGDDADRVEAWLGGDGVARAGAQGLAIFSSVRGGMFETVRLMVPPEPLEVVDDVPWLEPLASQITPGDWGVAVVSRRSARLLRGGPAALSEFALIDDELHGRHSQGGWSQARYQRGIEEQVALHARAVADRLLRAHRREPFAHLAIICSDELRPVLEHSLHSDLSAVLEATIDADLEHAALSEIRTVVAPEFERVEREREHELLAELDQGLENGGHAAAGLDEVLSALEERRVAKLVVADGSNLRAGQCPTCGRLSTDGERTCPLDGHTLVDVDAVAYAIDAAAGQSARVVVAHHEPEWLHRHGEIAALLRW